ncbi:hypothetical protein HMI55_002108 [Coelomomyces lativittatus]|nr:hypothetical protein HMI55_002108 [Coelomomyces lativittatus]
MGQPQPLQKETPCTPSRLLHTSFGHPPPIDFLTKASPSLHTIPNSCFISQPTSPFATPDYSQPIATTTSTATTSTITTSTITTTTAALKASTAVSTVVSPTSSSLTYYTNQSLASALLGEDSYPLQANPQSKHVSLPPPSDLKEPQSVSNLVSSPPQPKLLSKPGSTTHPIFSTLSPFTSHTSSKLNTCLECLKEGDTQTCIDTYTFLFNALRPHSSTSSSSSSSSSSQSSLKSSQSLSTPQKKIPTPSSETVDLDQVVTRLPEIYEFIKRDLKPSVPELVYI